MVCLNIDCSFIFYETDAIYCGLKVFWWEVPCRFWHFLQNRLFCCSSSKNAANADTNASRSMWWVNWRLCAVHLCARRISGRIVFVSLFANMLVTNFWKSSFGLLVYENLLIRINRVVFCLSVVDQQFESVFKWRRKWGRLFEQFPWLSTFGLKSKKKKACFRREHHCDRFKAHCIAVWIFN